jgi:hypothetical protein
VRAAAVARVAKLDDAEPGPGYTCFGGIGVSPSFRPAGLGSPEPVSFDMQMIAGWAPGGSTGGATPLPAGTAIRLAEGSRLVLQVHYSLANYVKGTTDLTRVELHAAKERGTHRQAFWIPIADWRFRVPAGASPDDATARAHAAYRAPLPLSVLGVAPHMHLRGKSVRIEADDQCLLDVPQWDFHMQEAYWLAEPRRASSASLTCIYDNRAEAQPRVNGKRKAPRELRWGEGTDDEMCLAFLYVTL